MKDRVGGCGGGFLGFTLGFGRTLRKICTTMRLIGKTIRLEMMPTSTCGINNKTRENTLTERNICYKNGMIRES